jgi:tetratricopeptide (TPR) repeat protein
MKKSLFILILLAVVSCGPTRHAITLQMRHPSRSGLDLGGKVVSVAYSTVGEPVADSFNKAMAGSFAAVLEDDYATGEGSVKVLGVDGTKADYAQRDSMINILMKTGSDMVFLFASPVFDVASTSGAVPMKVSLYCYDGMNKEDKVLVYTGTTVVTSVSTSSLENEAVDVGKNVSETFKAQWKYEQFSIAYFDNIKWYEALYRAEEYDWKGAMDIWLSMLDTNDLLKRAAAEYNISVACYLLGDFELAEEWLKKSKADNDMPTLTDAMSKRIEAVK